jgi:hypothetical protein
MGEMMEYPEGIELLSDEILDDGSRRVTICAKGKPEGLRHAVVVPPTSAIKDDASIASALIWAWRDAERKVPENA